MKIARFLALAMLAAPVTAQAPPPGARQIKIDVSPAGQAVLKKYLGTPDAGMVPMINQMRSLMQQMNTLTAAPKLDLAQLQALFRRQEAVEAAIKRHNNDRNIAMLTELSEGDRVRFVRSFRAGPPANRPPGGK